MKESDIRPSNLISKYLDLCEKDALNFPNKDISDSLPCIACGSLDYEFAFSKSDFSYTKCSHCDTVYLNPRPPLSSFELFYKNSLSSTYWSDVFFPSVAEIRRQSIFKPRVQSIKKYFEKRKFVFHSLMDVGAGFGLFLEEWRLISPSTSLYAIEPSPSLASTCRSKGFAVYEDVVEQIDINTVEKVDLIVCFEVLEHVHDPLSFIQSLNRFLKPHGRLLLTTLSFSGFDLQLLQDRSSQISPPHHINFFTLRGFQLLFETAGFFNIDITTPGKLDVDILDNFIKDNPDDTNIPTFVKSVMSSEESKSSFQDFLVTNNLSSHAWISCRA